MMRTWLIGCGPDCNPVVNRPLVASHHCRLSRGDDGVLLEDLGSPSGTFVNGARISAPTRVTPGDAITLGPDAPMPWPHEAIPPGWKILRIGREPDNDYLVNSPVVSGYHARLIYNGATGEATIEDLASSNGTALGAPDRKVRRAGMAPTETVYLGTHPIPAPALLALLGPVRVPLLTFRGREMTVGRDPGCDLVVDLATVSGRHARLAPAGDLILIEDLGSSNGTHVNGQRIDRPVVVKPGDRIRLGSYELELALGPAAADPGPAPTIAAGVPIVMHPASIPATGPRPWPRRTGLIALASVAVVLAISTWVRTPVPSPPPTTPAVGPEGPRSIAGPGDRDGPREGKDTPLPPANPAGRTPESLAKADEKPDDRVNDLVPPHVPPVEPTRPDVVPPPVAERTPPPDVPAPAPDGPRGHSPVPEAVAWANSLDLANLKPQDEIRLGNELHRLIVAETPTLGEPWSARAVEAASRVSNADYTITVLDSDAVNAFSMPGGRIYLCRGVIDMIGTDEDYALEFVIGHEMAHLELKHAPKVVQAGAEGARRQNIDTLNQFLVPIIWGYPDAMEYEADAWIFKRMMTQLGHTPRESLAFLRKFKDYAEKNGFGEGHNMPKPKQETVLVEDHFRGLPAARTRLSRLQSAFKTPAPK